MTGTQAVDASLIDGQAVGAPVQDRPAGGPLVPAPRVGSVPWTVNQGVGVYIGLTTAAVVVVLAWYQASGQDRSGPQLPWVAAGVAALMLAGTAGAVWFMAGRRAVGERRARLLAAITTTSTPVPANDPAGSDPGARLVAVPGASRYHLPGCPLVQGKAARASSRSAHERQKRTACGVCRP